MPSTMQTPLGPECSYGNKGYAMCSNPVCRKPGIICESGYLKKDECGLFHESCDKIKWAELEKMVYDNTNLSSPDFIYLREKIQGIFLNTIQRLKAEHSKFKIWIKTYGHSIEVMKFIKNLTEHDFSHVNGNYMAPIVAEMLNPKRVESPSIMESEIMLLEDQINEALDRISDLYLKPGSIKGKSSSTSSKPIPELKATFFNSRITQQMGSINRFFSSKITSFKLLFRASEANYSIHEFHKRCDGQSQTLTILETEFGKIIGGYTPIPWSSAKKQWAADKSLKSFIFSLNMREKFTLNLAQFAIANNPQKGPTFGCCDICIVDNSNKQRSNAQFPISYNNGKYIRGAEASIALTGHPKGQFLIKEWEVFQLTFE